MDFKKHDTVWYYLEKERAWRRGKIKNVNRYYLHVKDVARHKVYLIEIGHRVVDGVRAKPSYVPRAWYEVPEHMRQRLWDLKTGRGYMGGKRVDNRANLYKRLGIKLQPQL